MYTEFLNKSYINTKHSSIEMSPRERFMMDFEEIKRKTNEQIEESFLHTIKRNVKSDSTISLNAILYEVPQKYIKTTNTVKYNPENRDENFIQDLFLSRWLNRQCYFSKLGSHNVCFVINKGSTTKIFPGNYIVVQGIKDMTKKDYDLVTSYTEEQMKQLERVC